MGNEEEEEEKKREKDNSFVSKQRSRTYLWSQTRTMDRTRATFVFKDTDSKGVRGRHDAEFIFFLISFMFSFFVSYLVFCLFVFFCFFKGFGSFTDFLPVAFNKFFYENSFEIDRD